MKRTILGIGTALLFLAGCGNPSPLISSESPTSSYTEVGNGGDSIRILFEQGRQYAAGVVGRVDKNAMPSYLRESLEPGEVDWIFRNRELISSHIRRARHVWVEKLPKACTDTGCGCFLGGDEILLEQTRCQDTVKTRSESAQLLVHESLHSFFGQNETKVRRLGAAFFSLWANMGHPEYPHWKNIPNPPEELKPFSKSVWTGAELLVWDGETFAYYDPTTSIWRTEKPLNNLFDLTTNTDWVSIMRGQVVSPIWNSGVLNLFLCEKVPSTRFTEETRSKGVVYDPSLRSWREMNPQNMPSGCSLSQAAPFSIGGSIFYLGHRWKDPGRDWNTLMEAAIYSPSRDEWRRVVLPEELQMRKDASVLWTGSQVIFWGGWLPERYKKPNGLNSGTAFDPAANTWTELPLDGSPEGRMEHTATWTGSRMLLYGGVTSPTYDEREYLISGALYDPVRSKWSPMSHGSLRPQPHPYRFALRSIWVGTHVLLTDENIFVAYYPDRDEFSVIDFLVPRGMTRRGIGELPADHTWTGMEVFVWDVNKNRGFAFYPN